MQASALRILHLVSFLGERDDQVSIMRDADLGWVVAEGDTAAYGILDLMALAKPLVASEVGVAQHYVAHGISGTLYPADDSAATAATVAALLGNGADRLGGRAVGVDAGVAAGPIGRSAEAGVNYKLDTAIYAYSRSKGLFAGVALDGAVLDIDHSMNEKVYGASANTKAILNGSVAANSTVRPFMDVLEKVMPKKRVSQK